MYIMHLLTRDAKIERGEKMQTQSKSKRMLERYVGKRVIVNKKDVGVVVEAGSDYIVIKTDSNREIVRFARGITSIEVLE